MENSKMMDLYSESKRYNELMQNYKNILNRMKYLLSFTEITEDISSRKLKSQEELNLITNELLELKDIYLSENSSNSQENKIDKTKSTTEHQNTTHKLDQMNIKTQVSNKSIDGFEDINKELKKFDEIIKQNNENRQKSKYSLLKKCPEIMVKPEDKKIKQECSWEPDMLPYNASFMSLALSRNELPEVESKVADLCESNSQTHHEKYHILKSVFLREKVKNLNIENYSTCFSPVCWTRNLNCHKINSTLNSSLKTLTTRRSKPNLKYLEKHCPFGLGPTNFITMPFNVYHRKKSRDHENSNTKKKTYKDAACNTNSIKFRQICKRCASNLSDSAFPYETSNESLPFEVLEYKVQKLHKPKQTKKNKEKNESSNSQTKSKCNNKYIYEPSISSLPPDDDVIVSGCKKKKNKKLLNKDDFITYLAEAKSNINQNLVKENKDKDTDDDTDSDSTDESSDTISDDSAINCTKTNSPTQTENANKLYCDCEAVKYPNRTQQIIKKQSTIEQVCIRPNQKCVPNRNLQATRRQINETCQKKPDYRRQNSRYSGKNADEIRNNKESRRELKERDREMTYDEDCSKCSNECSSSEEDSETEEVKKQEKKSKHPTNKSEYPCSGTANKCIKPHIMAPLTPESDMSEVRSEVRSEAKSFESSAIMAPIPETPGSDCQSIKCKRRAPGPDQCKKYGKPSLIAPLTPSSYTATPTSVSEESEEKLDTPTESTPEYGYDDETATKTKRQSSVPWGKRDDQEKRTSSPWKKGVEPEKRTSSPWKNRDKSSKTYQPPTPSEEGSSSDDSSGTFCFSDKCSECEKLMSKQVAPRKHISTNTKPLPVIHDTSTNTGGNTTEIKTDNMHAWALAYVKFEDDGAKLVQILHTTRQAPGRYLLKEPNELILFGPQTKNRKSC